SPSRVEMKARCLPSGAQRGVFSVLPPPINSVGAELPSAATTQMSAFRAPLATSVVVRTNATDLPSGDSCGSAMRTAPSKSWIVIARSANAGVAAAKNATASKWDFMKPDCSGGGQRGQKVLGG